ncbi:hypothetical protein AX16_002943 [Volvariella volvacea WC 439]|nr:hypothetical protein AX16_002943 [Volvariella volvacea WC 439]
MSQEEERPPVLKASVHDVRYFATLLRGVNFANRATITATNRGITITVEEARTLLGTAYIFAEIFDEYAYHSENPRHRNLPSQQSQIDEDEIDNAAFEVPLNTIIECLNIFGTAGTASSGGSSHKRWKRPGGGNSDEDSGDKDGGGARGRGPIDQYFGSGSEKRTGMRMSYAGPGHPLTLIIAEDASGPTTTCEITTFDPEPRLELELDNEQLVLKIILKSSWLRDALSELDPSCEKLTFIGNPPPAAQAGAAQGRRRGPLRDAQPMLRIQADGTFGSTEMDYPNDREVLETFECKREVSFTYRYSHISRALRALQTSTKTSLRIDESGLLSLQFLMPTSNKPRGLAGGGSAGGEGIAAFIEFRVSS